MRLLLIQPPLEDFYATPCRDEPLGLLYLAAAARDAGHAVEVCDARAEQGSRVLPWPREFDPLREHYVRDTGPFSLFQQYRRYGCSRATLSRALFSRTPEAIGISSLFSTYHATALETARLASRLFPRALIFLGGHHPSAFPYEVLEEKSVSAVLAGEAERTLPAFLSWWEKGRQGDPPPGVFLRGTGGTPTADAHPSPAGLPFPARDLVDRDRYRLGKKRLAQVLSSRGCPHRCSYCTSSPFRPRAVAEVLAELRDLQLRHGIRAFDFEDDNFSADRERARELLSRMRAELPRPFDLSFMNGLCVHDLDDGLVEELARCGVRSLGISLGGATEENRRLLHRPGSTSEVDNIISAGASRGIKLVVYFIMGVPGQTWEDLAASLAWLAEREVVSCPSVYYPLPGKPGSHLPRLLWRSSACAVETESFTRLDLITLSRLSRLLAFLRKPPGSSPQDRVGLDLLRRFLDTGKCWGMAAGPFSLPTSARVASTLLPVLARIASPRT